MDSRHHLTGLPLSRERRPPEYRTPSLRVRLSSAGLSEGALRQPPSNWSLKGCKRDLGGAQFLFALKHDLIGQRRWSLNHLSNVVAAGLRQMDGAGSQDDQCRG